LGLANHCFDYLGETFVIITPLLKVLQLNLSSKASEQSYVKQALLHDASRANYSHGQNSRQVHFYRTFLSLTFRSADSVVEFVTRLGIGICIL
jgi:hypothetical protein